MDKSKILEIINERIDSLTFFNGDLVAWSEDTCEILKQIFGDDHHSARRIKDLVASVYDVQELSSDIYRNDEWSRVQDSITDILNTCLKEFEVILAQSQNKDDAAPINFNEYVNHSRINELHNIKQSNFDLVKLIRLCEELNLAYSQGLYYSTAMLVRAILDHIPPIFGQKTFTQVANNHGTKSWKDSMAHLEKSARKIADAHLHTPIRKSESLPNKIQVDSSRDLDVLFGEIVRIIKAK